MKGLKCVWFCVLNHLWKKQNTAWWPLVCASSSWLIDNLWYLPAEIVLQCLQLQQLVTATSTWILKCLKDIKKDCMVAEITLTDLFDSQKKRNTDTSWIWKGHTYDQHGKNYSKLALKKLMLRNMRPKKSFSFTQVTASILIFHKAFRCLPCQDYSEQLGGRCGSGNSKTPLSFLYSGN